MASSATVSSYCIVAGDTINPATPAPDKQKFTAGSDANALGFKIADYVYFGYGIDSSTAQPTG